MPTHHLTAKGEQSKEPEKICLFAQTNFRNQMIKFGIKTDDRRRHMYVIGKTGMGKTTMMENMVLHDIYNGHGIGIVDPHGDFAEKIIDYIPTHRINDVVYLNPADVNFPVGFNILEVHNEEQKHLIASGLMGIFKKIWPDVWSARMEYILNNTILALLDTPGTTLMGINRLLADKKYRNKVVRQLKDPVVKSFWRDEFDNYEPRYAKEAVAPIQNKIGQFLSASVIRNMVAQVKSTIDVREIMDSGKIFIMNLSKGRIGEDNSRLLGGMIITKIQLAAMERVDIPEADRRDFFLYVDEFQNFATPSFANILSEARKYRLSLIMAHQYVKQLDEVVADAVFGNVGTIVTFRVGAGDAEALAKEFAPTFIEEHIVNLNKYQILLKLMIDGVASQPFSALTMSPIGSATGSSEKVIRVSRERYAKTRSSIEDKILRWSGMEAGGIEDDDDDSGTNDTPQNQKGDAKKKEKKSFENSGDKGSKKSNESKNNKPKKENNAPMDDITPMISLADLKPREPQATSMYEESLDEEDVVPVDPFAHIDITRDPFSSESTAPSVESLDDAIVDSLHVDEPVHTSDSEILTSGATLERSVSDVPVDEHMGTMHMSNNTVDPMQSQKKKRKRKRKKKKKNGNGENNGVKIGSENEESRLRSPQAESRPESGKIENHTKELKDANQEVRQDTTDDTSNSAPTKMSADDIISFD